MNNLNNKQNIKFNNQVNHLSSFIGMPMWNGRNPSLSQIREYDRRVMEQQALGFSTKKENSLKRVFGGLLKLTLRTLSQSIKIGKKVSGIKPEIIKPVKTGECC